jgi:hypothetical protein
MTSPAMGTDRSVAGSGNSVKSWWHELRGGAHPIAQMTGGLCHPLVVYDEFANVAAKALRCCEMNRIERSELMWLQHSCSGEKVVAHTHEIASSQDGTAGGRRLFTARQEGAQHLGSSEGTRDPRASAAQIAA